LDNYFHSYVEFLCLEIASSIEKYRDFGKVVSIYIGGGTPSALPTSLMDKVISTCFSVFSPSSEIEMTIEANPENLTFKKLKKLKALGFNRLSIGAQSFNDELLKVLGRGHSADETLKCYLFAREAGFQNINLDLIFGIPNQTVGCWIETLEIIAKLNPDHVSAYSLEVHEDTLLHKQICDGLFSATKEDAQADMYFECLKYLSKEGFCHYEISNFAKEGKECKHNLLYWKNGNYLGFGAGAHSHIENLRFENVNNPNDYIEALRCGKKFLEICEKLSSDKVLSETIFLGLRLVDGINLDEFKRKFDRSLIDIYERQIEDLKEKGLVVCQENLKLTEKGLFLANEVFIQFIPD